VNQEADAHVDHSVIGRPAAAAVVLALLASGCAGGSSAPAHTSASNPTPPQCPQAHAAVVNALHAIQARQKGDDKEPADAAALRRDSAQLDRLRKQSTDPRLESALDAIYLQLRLYALAIDQTPHDSFLGTAKRFFRPFNKLAAICGQGSS